MNTKVAKHLSIPENRINYCFHFLDNFNDTFVDYKKCYDKLAEWSDKLDTSESHFWWELFYLLLLLLLALWLVLMLLTTFQKCRMQRWHVFANLFLLVHLMMKCVRSFDENNNCNLFDSSYRTRRIYIVSKDNAHTSNNTQRDQITEHKVMQMGREVLS